MKNIWYEIPEMESFNPQSGHDLQIENLCSRQTRRYHMMRKVEEASSVRFGSSGLIPIVHPK